MRGAMVAAAALAIYLHCRSNDISRMFSIVGAHCHDDGIISSFVIYYQTKASQAVSVCFREPPKLAT